MTDKTNTHNSARIEYIDALRGFTMLLVVVQHAASYYFNVTVEMESIHHYLQQIRMPLFFFISGFLFFKESTYWNISNSTRFIKKKTIIQILSPTLFMLLYVIYREGTIEEALFSRHKYSYWFTYTLFEYFIFYITAQQIIRTFKIKSPASDAVILLFTALICALSTDAVSNRLPWDNRINELLGIATWRHFIFFVAGTLTKKYFGKFEKLIDNTPLLPLSVSVYILMNIFDNNTGTLSKAVFYTLVGMCGVITIFSLFRKYKEAVSQENRAGRIIQFVGRRTLDIYLLHGFFMMSPIARLIPETDNINPIVEFILSLAISIVIVAACLAVSYIIRLSPVAAHYLFGANNQK